MDGVAPRTTEEANEASRTPATEQAFGQGGTEPPGHWRKVLIERVDLDFTYHPPPDQPTVAKYEEVRDAVHHCAVVMVEATPGPCRELSTALTRLEEAVMHCNAGIARNTKVSEDSQPVD